jgi:methylenetetrahydrofolate--tRNA-(uracil-5-)-methyltransferase
LIAALAAARELSGEAPEPVPADTALGAVVAHLQNAATADFQPANVSWAFFSPLPGKPIRDKRERRRALADRALVNLERWRERVVPAGDPLPV